MRQLPNDERITYIREVFPALSDDDKLELAVFLLMETLNDGDGH